MEVMNLRYCLALLIALALPGCGTQQLYSGDARPPTAISTIKTPGFTSGIAFMEVDGGRVNPFQSHSVEVLPGKHLVHIWIQRRHLGDTFHILFPMLSATAASSYYCAKFEAVTKPGITYRIAVREKALVLEDNNREVVANITKLRPVPFGNIMTSTPTDCS